MLIARNMDFTSLGSAGSDSVLVRYKNFSSLTIPGLIGVVTGWNNSGLVGIVNVSHNQHKRDIHGTPVTFLARSCLEDCESVAKVWNKYDAKELQPTASFHFTFADQNDCGCISFAQTTNNDDGIFRNPKQLLIFNYTYTQHVTDKNTADSCTREQCVTRFLADHATYQTPQDLLGLLKHPTLNVFDTLHSLVIDVTNNCAWISTNNCYAADSHPSKVRMVVEDLK